MQVASLLYVLLWETHDQPEWFAALLPVIIDCCSILADLARTSADTFAEAVAMLTLIAKQSSSSGTADFFRALAVDDRVAVEAQALFCLLAATSSSTSGATQPDDALGQHFFCVAQQSNMAPVAAKAIGDRFATAANSPMLGSLVALTLEQEPRGRAANGSSRQQTVGVPVLPSSYNELVFVPHNIAVSNSLHHVVLLARVRLDAAPGSLVTLTFDELLTERHALPGAYLEMLADITLQYSEGSIGVGCYIRLRSSNDGRGALGSPAPALCFLPVNPGPCEAGDVLTDVLSEPVGLWEDRFHDLSCSGPTVCTSFNERGRGVSPVELDLSPLQLQSGSDRDLDHLVALGIPLCL